MKVLHVTDLHLVPAGETLWGLDPIARFEACLNDLTRHHADAAFCVITGDLAERGEPEVYRALKARLARFPIETHLLLGNHDDRAAYLAEFSACDASGFAQAVIVREGRHFLFLDTLKGPPSSAGLYCEARRSWLAAQLAAAKGAPVYLFMHHPPFDIGHALMDRIKLDDADAFAGLLDGQRIAHLFFGHAHRPMSGQWRGIPFSALPSLNHQLPLTGGAVSTVYSDEPPMYGVILIEEDRTIVHSDAFLHRQRAIMQDDQERETWY